MNDLALPAIITEIADAAGADAAWALVSQHGGTKVYIPQQVRQDHWLALLVGLDAARKICARMGGADIMLPHATRHRGRVALVEALRGGASLNDAARASGMTVRSASRARSKLGKSACNQGDLFD